MSDASGGPGWWQASDGKWYAPELHADYQPPATRPTPTLTPEPTVPIPRMPAIPPPGPSADTAGTSAGPSRGLLIGGLVGLAVVVGGVSGLALGVFDTGPAGPGTIAYMVWSEDETELFTVLGDGTERNRAYETDVIIACAALSPDRETFALITRDNDGERSYLHMIDVESGSEDEVWDERSEGWPNCPAWSEDGSKAIFAFTELDSAGDQTDLLVYEVESKRVETIARLDGAVICAAWSPDGESVILDLDEGDGYRIATMTADGRGQDWLTSDDSDAWCPFYSPDGTQIVFQWWPGADAAEEDSEIFVMDADGYNERNVTDHAGNDECAVWSPDGTEIAFASRRDIDEDDYDEISEIFVMSADGTNLRSLRVEGCPISWTR